MVMAITKFYVFMHDHCLQKKVHQFFSTHVGIHLDQFWILWNLEIQTSIQEYVIKLFYNEKFHGDFST
jgi:hypothetical protein